MPTKVINLKASPPIEGGEHFAEQASAAHRYHNLLVEIHRAFHVEREDAKRRHIPGLIECEADVEAAEKALADLRAQVKRRNAAARRKTATPEDKAAITAARQELADLRARRKELRAQAATSAPYQSVLAALVEKYQGTLIDSDSTRRKGGLLKDARANCGVYSGSYLRVEAAVEQSVQTSFSLPAFRRWDGSARLGPQIVPPMSVGDLLRGDSTKLRIEFARGGNGKRVIMWVRIGSAGDSGREPIWCKIPCTMHRPLPDDAQIKWATIVRRQNGVRRHKHPTIPEGEWRPYYEWSMQLTIGTAEEPERAESGACGANLGWRQMPDGSLRVATAVNDDGQTHRLMLPAPVVARWRKADDIRAIRDGRFNEARDKLAVWLAANEHPEWLRKATTALVQWRSKRRLGGVIGRWSAGRFAGDGDIFAALIAWREKDVHLEQYESSIVASAQRTRKAMYQQFAAMLRQTYHLVAYDGTRQADLARLPRAESNESVNETARYNSRLAAPSLLRQMLKNGGGIAIDSVDVTRTCHACGSVEMWDQEHDIEHICDDCGAEWDQDENAARNILARAVMVDENPAPARDPQDDGSNNDAATAQQRGGKWARRKADRSRRQAQTST